MFAIRELRDTVTRRDFEAAISKVLGSVGDEGEHAAIYG
jgi:ATP-dependent 26S proteasome regulatory subunit